MQVALDVRRPVWGLVAVLASVAVACGARTDADTKKAASDAAAVTVVGLSRDDAGAADPIVDLLHSVDATVAVSSKVENPHDYPEHLVDGKADTAWNGKTGDLNGFVAFRVPKSATVVRVEITSGFDKVGAKGDMFTMNHRIKKVRLTREGALVKEVTLDVEQRGLQAIDVEARGGDFKLEITETVPGTEAKWRELTVSEFRVWGRAGGAPPNPTHLPKMAIGNLDGVPAPKVFAKSDPPRGPFKTVAELCAAYDKVMTPILDAKYPDDNYPGRLPGPHCKATSVPGFAARTAVAPFKSASFVDIDELDQQRAVLAVETDKGWFRTDVRAWSRYHMDPGCLHMDAVLVEEPVMTKTTTGQEVALLRIVEREIAWMQMDLGSNGATSIERAYACRIDANGAPTCEGPIVLATAHEPLPASFNASRSPFNDIHVDKTPWTARKKAVLGPAGDLRVE